MVRGVVRVVSFGFESLNEFKTSFPRVGDKLGWSKLIGNVRVLKFEQ